MNQMKPPFRSISALSGLLLVAAALPALVILTGCGRGPSTSDEDANLGSYLVNVEVPSLGARIEIDPSKTTISTGPFHASVSCSPKNVPPDCDQNVPNWTSRQPPGTDFLTLQFADPTKSETDFTITLDVQKYLKAYGPNNDISSIGSHWFQMSVYPTSVPGKLKLAGKRDFVVDVGPPYFNQTKPRQEQPSDKPRLSAVPNRMPIAIVGTNARDTEQVESGELTYSGPATQITEAALSGSGAAKFTVLAPALPYALKEGQSTARHSVRFATDQNDLNYYEAIITFSTANNAVCNVVLTGHRTSL